MQNLEFSEKGFSYLSGATRFEVDFSLCKEVVLRSKREATGMFKLTTRYYVDLERCGSIIQHDRGQLVKRSNQTLIFGLTNDSSTRTFANAVKTLTGCTVTDKIK